MVLSRGEDFLAATPRPAMRIWIRSGVKDGKIVAREAKILVDAGAFGSEGAVYGNGSVGDTQWQLRVTGWYNRVDELIVFECNASFTICAPENVESATLKGIELRGGLTWPATSIQGSLDLQSPRDDTTGTQLPRRALRHGALTLTQQVGPVSLGAEVIASSLRYDDAANTIKMGGYTILNLTATWPLGYGLTLFVRGDNVFNKDYQLAADYSTGGAQVFVGLRWALH